MNEIYVVQSRSGIVFMATDDYGKAKDMKDSLDEGESHGEKGIMSTWVNGKMISKLTDKFK